MLQLLVHIVWPIRKLWLQSDGGEAPFLKQQADDFKERITEETGIITAKLERWLEYFYSMLPNFILAILSLVVFYFLASFIRRSSDKLLGKFGSNQAVSKIVAYFLGIAVMFIGIAIALSVMRLDKVVASLLAGAGLIGVALGFAFQDITVNLISGVLIAVKRPFIIGDVIDSNTFFGTVRKMDMRSVIIENTHGQWITLPNKNVLENPIINYSVTGKRLVEVKIGVSYGEDLERVRELTLTTILRLDKIDKTKDIDFFFTDFGDSSINFVVRFWITFSRQTQYLNAVSEAIIKIKQSFDNNDIMIPFPIRTLDFGIKGGEKLSTQISGNNFKIQPAEQADKTQQQEQTKPPTT